MNMARKTKLHISILSLLSFGFSFAFGLGDVIVVIVVVVVVILNRLSLRLSLALRFSLMSRVPSETNGNTKEFSIALLSSAHTTGVTINTMLCAARVVSTCKLCCVFVGLA